jgi:hypothetical protein
MPLTRSECADLVRQVQNLLREYDPGAFETIIRAYPHPDDPRRHLMLLLQIVGKVYSERSGGQYSSILDSLNHFVRLEDGGPVRGLSVSLTPSDREIYGRDEISLAELPDRTEFVRQIERVTSIIDSEIDWRDGQ